MSYKKIVSLPYNIKKGKRQTQSFYIQNGDFSKLKKIITKEIVSNNLSSTHQHPTKTYTDLLLQWLQWSFPAWFFLASFPRPVWPLAPICPQQRDQYSFIVPRNAAEWYCFFNQFPGNG